MMRKYFTSLLVTLALVATVIHLFLLGVTEDTSMMVQYKHNVNLYTENQGINAMSRRLKNISTWDVTTSNTSQIGVYLEKATINKAAYQEPHETLNLSIPDLQEIKLRLSPKELCSITEDTPRAPYLLVLIHSAVNNKENRYAIRDTWGKITKDFDSELQVRVVFLLGIDPNETDNSQIEKESKLYRDILQGEFVDSYANLTIKSLMGLQWSYGHCQGLTHVLKTDDDVYLNVTKILQFLQNSKEVTIVGAVNIDAQVMRTGLWNVDKASYPGSVYPPYCSGAAYAINVDVIPKLLNSLPQTKVLQIEDAYITGILAKESGYTCQHSALFPSWTSLATVDTVCLYLQGELAGVHVLHYMKIFKMQKIATFMPLDCKRESDRDFIFETLNSELLLGLYEYDEDGFS